MTAGVWVRVSASNQDAVLGVGPTSGSTIHYCNQMPWNPQRSAIEIVAMDHNAGMQRYMRYNALSNASSEGAGAYDPRYGRDDLFEPGTQGYVTLRFLF